MEITGAILCGGKSSRLGMEKAFQNLKGKPIFEHVLEKFLKIFSNIIISANNKFLFSKYNIPIVEDIYKDKDVIGGIHSILKHIDTEYAFIAACDMPFIEESAIKYMIEQAGKYDVVVPRVKGKYQPLFAIYSKKCLNLIEANIKRDKLKLAHIIENSNSNIITGKELKKYCNISRHFFNINTEEDFLRALKENFSDPTLIGIVAKYSNSGKTTLIEKLIKIFKLKQYKVGIVKHTFHNIEFDKKGKDSYRFFHAGSDAVVINSEKEIIFRKKLENVMPVKYIKDKLLKDMDIVIVEGHKTGNFAKIELIKDEQKDFLFENDRNITALVTNKTINCNLPQFKHSEIEQIADFIEKELLI